MELMQLTRRVENQEFLEKNVYTEYMPIYTSLFFLSIKAFDKLNLDQASKKESYTEL